MDQETPIDMIQVPSTNVDSVGYDAPSQTLLVTFKSGDTYQYDGVTADIYAALVLSPSIGKYIREVISQQFNYTKL